MTRSATRDLLRPHSPPEGAVLAGPTPAAGTAEYESALAVAGAEKHPTSRLHPRLIPLSVLVLVTSVGMSMVWLIHEVAKTDFSQFVNVSVLTFGTVGYVLVTNRRLKCRPEIQQEMGPYILKELLGAGGMGDVYLAEHRLLKRLCAVKLVRQDRANSRHLIECFEQEVKATAQLTHWNTVQVYDYGRTQSGRFYYAMEYLRGLNLLQLVDRHGPLPPARGVFILKQICGALNEAAKHGLVHRDIKPSNIFLAERGQVFDVVKLLDFGLVRPASEVGMHLMNARRQLQGSPRYMCPEQAKGLTPDCRGDLYSLGCVAYFLLTGRPPFDEPNPVLVVVAHGTQPVPTFTELGFDVPQDLSNVILKCLKKDPADRFTGPRELELALSQCRCAGGWTDNDAEDWWRRHEVATPTAVAESMQDGLDTDPAGLSDNRLVRDPDSTVVVECSSR